MALMVAPSCCLSSQSFLPLLPDGRSRLTGGPPRPFSKSVMAHLKDDTAKQDKQ
jgi:hypothetical protein